MRTRTARCSCGDLQAHLAGEPNWVIVCHCLECQRRTGSVCGVSAYFPRTSVTSTGKHQTYARSSDSGRSLTNHFCPRCGTTVLWDLEMLPDFVGVAVGTIGDPSFNVPTRSLWEATRHPWVEFACKVDRFRSQ
jgi:hypothetical protein